MSTKAFIVRPAILADVEQIARVHVDSIWTLGAKAYERDVIEEWGQPRDGTRPAKAMSSGEQFFLAEEGPESENPGEPLGFSGCRLEQGRFRTAVYVVGRAARLGVGKALFQAAEHVALQRGATEIHVDAALGAVPFYKSNGFIELGQGAHTLHGGALMRCVFMKKAL